MLVINNMVNNNNDFLSQEFKDFEKLSLVCLIIFIPYPFISSIDAKLSVLVLILLQK